MPERNPRPRQLEKKGGGADDAVLSAFCGGIKNGTPHHWEIEPPEGRFSSGVCIHCSASRKFPNSPEAISWHTNETRGSFSSQGVESPEFVRRNSPDEIKLSDEI